MDALRRFVVSIAWGFLFFMRLSGMALSRLLPRAPRGGFGAAVRRGWPYAVAALLAAGVVVQLVRLIWALTVPIGPYGDWRPQPAQIIAASQRGALFRSFDPFFRGALAGPVTAQVTAMNLKLYGVNVNEAMGGGSAILAGEDGVQASYGVGDEVMAGVKLVGVAFDHVILERGGARESLFMDQSGGGQGAVTPVADLPTEAPADIAAPLPVGGAAGE